MIAHHFDYRDPHGMDDALRILAEGESDCAVLGGGTWLVPNMTFAVHQPAIVLDPRHLGISDIVESERDVFVGARATYRAALRSPSVQSHLPLLAAMCGQITGGASIVGQGTIGGSACYANPSSDVPACLISMRAELQLRSMRGVRVVPAEDFFLGAFETARHPDELLVGIIFPKSAAASRYGYHKLKFSTGSWPIVTAAVVAVPAASGWRLRVVLGASSGVPIVTEGVLSFQPEREELQAFAQSCVRLDAEWSDELAGPGYRRTVAPSVILKALSACGVNA